MRRKVIAGNWKMNMLPNEAIDFIQELTPLVKDTKNEVILCVPYTDLFYALLHVQDTNIKIGAQNMHWEEKGAYTGEVSAPMLKSIGVEYVIIGHSERRQYFAETDETVNKKIKSALAHGLKPIVCVGETLEQREAGETEKVVTNQIAKAFEGIEASDLEKIIVAYEPIWAIGTGKTATKEDANATKLADNMTFSDKTVSLASWICMPKYAEENRDVLVRFTRALFKAMDYAAADHQEDTAALIAKQIAGDQDTVYDQRGDAEWLTGKEVSEGAADGTVEGYYELQKENFIEAGAVEVDPPVSDYVLLDVMKEAGEY